MQLYKQNISHDGTHRQARGWSANAALLVEELVEIYNTPTPKGWHKVEKIVLIDWFSQQPRPNIYTQNLNINPT